jgi:hypothetical protein
MSRLGHIKLPERKLYLLTSCFTPSLPRPLHYGVSEQMHRRAQGDLVLTLLVWVLGFASVSAQYDFTASLTVPAVNNRIDNCLAPRVRLRL